MRLQEAIGHVWPCSPLLSSATIQHVRTSRTRAIRFPPSVDRVGVVKPLLSASKIINHLPTHTGGLEPTPEGASS